MSADAQTGFVVELEEDFTVANAERSRALLLAAFAQTRPIAVDARRVAAIDLAGVQLLLAARRSADVAHRPLHFTGIQGRVAEVLDLLRLRHCLDAVEAGCR